VLAYSVFTSSAIFELPDNLIDDLFDAFPPLSIDYSSGPSRPRKTAPPLARVCFGAIFFAKRENSFA
jgi:hypothetical protein